MKAVDADRAFDGYVTEVSADRVVGWVARSAQDHATRLELLRNGAVIARAVADLDSSEVPTELGRQDWQGFVVSLTQHPNIPLGELAVRVAGTTRVLPSAPPPGAKIDGRVEEISPHRVMGWACLAGSSIRLAIDVVQGGALLATGIANIRRSDLAAKKVSDGYSAFEIRFATPIASVEGLIVRVKDGPTLIPARTLRNGFADAKRSAPAVAEAKSPADAKRPAPAVAEAKSPADAKQPAPAVAEAKPSAGVKQPASIVVDAGSPAGAKLPSLATANVKPPADAKPPSSVVANAKLHSSVVPKPNGSAALPAALLGAKAEGASATTSAAKLDFRAMAAAAFSETHYRRLQARKLKDSDDAFRHWWDSGRHEGIDPHPLFRTGFYLAQVSHEGVTRKDAFLHFLHRGSDQNIDPHPCFSQLWYRSRYLDRELRHPWLDYISLTDPTRRDPNWLFCSSVVADMLGHAAPGDGTLLARFLASDLTGSPHPLLDIDYVRRHHKFEAAGGENIYSAFWAAYKKKEFRIGSGFDVPFYRSQLAGRAPQFQNCLMDYTLVGEKDGLKPNPLFDPAWYAEQRGDGSPYNSLLEDYLVVGEKLYRSPCPGFDPRYYLERHPDVARAGARPLAHYIGSGQREGRRPHARFDVAFYKAGLDEADAAQPLQHFLEKGRYAARTPHPAVMTEPSGLTGETLTGFFLPSSRRSDVVPYLRTVLTAPHEECSRGVSPLVAGQAWLVDRLEDRILRSSPIRADLAKRNETIARQYEHFDENASEDFAQELEARFARSGATVPLISVIVPTRNRARVLQRAINSVLGQTHRNIELLIVDDGSTDGTAEMIAKFFDNSRIHYIPIKASGVSAARNTGLRYAKGEIVAYLDSDNYWEPRHLELTAKALLLSDVPSAYSVLRIFNKDGVVRFRGDVYSDVALRRENYIDMNVFMHRRSVAEAGIRFDETLRRCVDWDFILKATSVGDPLFVPILGCDYVDDSDTLERITTDELSGDFFKVCQRNMDLAPHTAGRPPAREPSLSVIWPISETDWATAQRTLWQMLQHAAQAGYEIIVINNALPAQATNYLNAVAAFTTSFRVVNLWRSFYEYPAANLAATLARGKQLLLWRSGVEYDSHAVEQLAEMAAASAASVVIPVVVDTAGFVSSELAAATLSATALLPLLTGQTPPASAESVTGIVPVTSPVIVRADAFQQGGGFSASFAEYFGLADFSLDALSRNPAATELRLGCRFRSFRPLHAPQPEKRRIKEFEAFRTRWYGRLNVGLDMPPSMKVVQPSRRQYENVGWNLLPGMQRGARLSMPATRRAIRFAIRCPAPDGPEKMAWGDYFYGMSIIAALERAGHSGCIEYRSAWDEEHTDGDIVLHLRGIVDLKPVRGKVNAVWIISHPEKVTAAEYGGMDVVFAAGLALRDHLRTSRGIQAQLLPQATDPAIFSPDKALARPELHGRPLFVGNSRMQIRPIVIDAVQMDLPLLVRGQGWDSFIPNRFVHGGLIPNEELASWYGSAGVVLNDHWLTMREYGIISNRLFDVAATGRPVITDPIEGLEPIFGASVRVYRSKEELADLVSELARMPIGERSLMETARRMHAEHSFDARIATILSTLGVARR